VRRANLMHSTLPAPSPECAQQKGIASPSGLELDTLTALGSRFLSAARSGGRGISCGPETRTDPRERGNRRKNRQLFCCEALGSYASACIAGS
jgi:hypothetical protein